VTVDAKGRVTSASSGSGSAPTTAQVLSATAGASAGAVGTYAFLGSVNAATYAAGATLAGSSLRYAGMVAFGWQISAYPVSIGVGSANTAPAGTWRAMGHAFGGFVSCYGDIRGATVWLRIS
jgi:hypothetical protein